MTTSLSLTESNILTALRAFLLEVLPVTAPAIEVVRGQDNLVAPPAGADFLVMTPIMRERLATNTAHTSDGFPTGPQIRTDLQPVKVTVQLDVHGPNSADYTHIVTTLFRSDDGVDLIRAAGFDVAPLYHSDPRQMPFVNAEQQVEERWSIDLVLQANPIVTTSQDFAGTLKVGVIEVDATYPPA